MNAQITYNARGKMMIGTNPTTEWEATHNYSDTTTVVRIFGDGDYGCNVRISFGDQPSEWGYNVLIGEQGNTDCDKMWLHGKLGLAYTFGTNSIPDTLFQYNPANGNYFQFNCDVRTTGVFVASDSRFKENIAPIENSLDGLKSLSAVSYNLKPRLGLNYANANQGYTEKDLRDKAFFDKFYGALQNDPTRYGLIAQEVKEVYPELVRTDEDGYMYVDYIGLVPILVDAINHLQAEVSELKGEAPAINKSRQRAGDGMEDVAGVMQARLYQNAPNPFTESTVIRYALPESVQTATLYVYDLQGKQVKSLSLAERGEASVSIKGSDLRAGMYIYALIADGEEVASRRMILTE